MAITEVSVVPLGTGTTSISRYVARAVNVLRGQGDIKYQLTAMGTILEGDLGKLLRVAREMHEAVFGEEVTRVVTTIKIDDRRDRRASMEAKVESLRKELGGGL